MNAGDTISRYRILGQLGKGGMGVVYRAEDLRLNRTVALKFLPGESLTEMDRMRFLNEARAAAIVHHPNICPVYDIEEEGGTSFIAMACLEGETLSRKLAHGALPVRDALRIAIQVASGLECAHECGVVHRDIKSGNIMVGPDGHVSIMDFGLALLPDATRLTNAGSVLGTPSYMSPEQARGAVVDRRSDVWSLGVVLYEMLAGTLPFRRDHSTAVIHAIVFDQPPGLTTIRPELPEDLIRAVDRALAKRPEDRWQTAREFAAELRRIEAGSGGGQARHLNDSQSTQTVVMQPDSGLAAPTGEKRVRGRVPFIAALLVILLGGVGGGTAWYLRSRAMNEAVPGPAEQQVAVLPFTVIGEGEGTRTVSDGLVEILTSALSDVQRFQGKVVAVPASEIRRRRIGSAEEARRVYGVNLAITGSAIPSGKAVQFTLSLVDTAKLRQLGSKAFLYDPANPLVARDQAVNVMAQLLNFQLEPATATAIRAGDSGTPGAYSAYLEARGLLARFDVAGNTDQSISEFQKAIAADPKYALAYSGLGEAYYRKALATGDKQWSAMAVRNAERAVELDGSLGLTHVTLGFVYGSAGRESEAVAELQKAMKLSPANADAPRELARIYTNLGRFAEAEALYVQAANARPTDWYGHFLLGVYYFQRDQFDPAEREIRKASDLAPGNDLVLRSLAGVYTTEGRYEDSVELLKKSLTLKANPSAWVSLGLAYYYQHKFSEAVSATEAGLEMDSSQYRWWGNLGAFCKWAPGNEKKGQEALRHAVEMGRRMLSATPTDYSLRANLAEYEARLGHADRAMREIAGIPAAVRPRFGSRLAVAWELTGHRREAVELIRASMTTAVSLNQIRDDPDLAGVWKDPAVQAYARSIGH